MIHIEIIVDQQEGIVVKRGGADEITALGWLSIAMATIERQLLGGAPEQVEQPRQQTPPILLAQRVPGFPANGR